MNTRSKPWLEESNSLFLKKKTESLSAFIMYLLIGFLVYSCKYNQSSCFVLLFILENVAVFIEVIGDTLNLGNAVLIEPC